MCRFLHPNYWDVSSANNDKSPGWKVIIMDCHLRKRWQDGKKESCDTMWPFLISINLLSLCSQSLVSVCPRRSSRLLRQMFRIRWQMIRKERVCGNEQSLMETRRTRKEQTGGIVCSYCHNPHLHWNGAKLSSMFSFKLPSLHSLLLNLITVAVGASAYPSYHGVRCRVHPGQIPFFFLVNREIFGLFLNVF